MILYNVLNGITRTLTTEGNTLGYHIATHWRDFFLAEQNFSSCFRACLNTGCHGIFQKMENRLMGGLPDWLAGLGNHLHSVEKLDSGWS